MGLQLSCKKDVSDLKVQLQSWKNSTSNPEFNLMSTLESIIKIIEPIKEDSLNFQRLFLQPHGIGLTHTNKFHCIRKLLNKEKKFFRRILYDYLSEIQNDKYSTESKNADKLLIAICQVTYLIYPIAVDHVIKNYDTNLVSMLFTWAEQDNSLFCYATALLSCIMQEDSVALKYYNENEKLISTLFIRLHKLFEYQSNLVDVQCEHEKHINVQQISDIEVVKQETYIFRYLTTVGESNTLLKLSWKYNIINIFLQFLNTVQTNEKKNENNLSEAFYCLSVYLRRREFCLKFIAVGGLERLFQIIIDKKIVSKGIALCLVNLSYCGKAMSYICRKKKNIVPDLVSSALSLLNSHYSEAEICNIFQFFHYSLAYRIIVEKFDEQNGLQSFENVMRSSILNIGMNNCQKLRKDRTKLFAWQQIRGFCSALKAYWHTHLYWCMIETHKLQDKKYWGKISRSKLRPHHPCYLTDDEANEKVEFLMLFPRTTEFEITKQYYSFDLFFLPIEIFEAKHELSPFINISGFMDEIVWNCLNIIKLSLLDDKIISLIFDEPEEKRLVNTLACFMNNIDYRSFGHDLRITLQIFGNLLWTHIYRFDINNFEEESFNSIKKLQHTNTYISTGRKNFYKIINVMRNENFILLLHTCLISGFFQRANFFRLLVAAAFDKNIQPIFYGDQIFCDTFTVSDLRNLIPLESDSNQILFRMYAINLVKSIENNPKLYNQNYKETEHITVSLLKRSGGSKIQFSKNYVYRKFKKVLQLRPNYHLQDIDFIISCKYSPCGKFLFTGTVNGFIKMYNAYTGAKIDTEKHYFQSRIISIDIHKYNNLLLTGRNLWNPMTLSHRELEDPFFDVLNSQFSKLQDKIVGCNRYTAVIYDVETGNILKKYSSSCSNDYSSNNDFYSYNHYGSSYKNQATFSINDQFLLNDGRLWDVKSDKEIYKFEKLYSYNGVFHPNGNEVIFSEYIYDLRTYQLLKIVPTLNGSSVIFSPTNSIYAYNKPSYDSNKLTTYDSSNYSLISTYQLEKYNGIEYLTCHPFIPRLAVAETSVINYETVDSVIQIYDAGMDNNED